MTCCILKILDHIINKWQECDRCSRDDQLGDISLLYRFPRSMVYTDPTIKSRMELKDCLRVGILFSFLKSPGCSSMGAEIHQDERARYQKHCHSFYDEYKKVIETLQKAVIDLEEKCHKHVDKIKELRENNADLKRKLKDDDSEAIKLKERKDKARAYSYTDAVRKCVYKLLSYHISLENVGPVIETVLKMIGKTADHIPSATTISNMNKERLLVAQYQLKELTQAENMTIGTDETPKAGDIYVTYMF